MVRAAIEIRKVGLGRVRLGVIGTLILTCVWISSASARQSSTGEAAGSKSGASTTATTTQPHNSAATAKKSTGKTHTATSRRGSKRRKSARVRGQQKIDSERALAIQEALIREHYLSGEPTGTWNQASEEAMRRYQADHGWQSKTVPDSRALIKLGLGPSKDHLLNPESAMTTVPDAPKTESTPATPRPATDPAPASNSNQSDPSHPQ